MLVKWDPFKEMERSFNDIFRQRAYLNPIWDDRNQDVLSWQPPVNVYENKENLLIEAQLPGIDLKDVNVSVTDHTLTFKGERRVEHEENKEGYHFREAQYGTFARSFSLPSYVNPEGIKATYEKGVLNITVPKQEKAKPRAIEIEGKN